MVRLERAVRGWRIVGRTRYLTVKWLRPDVAAVRAGVWQRQVGRLLVRVSRTLAAQPRESSGS